MNTPEKKYWHKDETLVRGGRSRISVAERTEQRFGFGRIDGSKDGDE